MQRLPPHLRVHVVEFLGEGFSTEGQKLAVYRWYAGLEQDHLSVFLKHSYTGSVVERSCL
jgi:hypothetical protein